MKIESLERACRVCGGLFFSFPSANRKFCSRKCFLSTRKKSRGKCKSCGAGTPRFSARFCSSKCYHKSRRGVPLLKRRRRFEKLCLSCGATFKVGGRLKHPWAKFCDTACSGASRRLPMDSAKSLNTYAWNEIRKRILKRDRHRCRFCGRGDNLQVHHLIPRKYGGVHDDANLVSTCRHCHGAIDRVIDLIVEKSGKASIRKLCTILGISGNL